jgi:hypothetical protein
VVTVKKSSFFKMTKQGEYGTYLDLKCGFSKPILFVIRSIPTLFGSTKAMKATDLRADVILDRNRRFSCTTALSFSPSSCLQFLTVIRSIPTLFGSTKTMEATYLRADVILD